MGKPRDVRRKDLFRPALDEIIDMRHALVRLAKEIDWDLLDQRFRAVCQPGPGQPPLPTRLVAGLMILKHTYNLSDEALCAPAWKSRLAREIVSGLRPLSSR
jgi:IS5 family transposase